MLMPGVLVMVVVCVGVWTIAYRTMVRHPLDFAAVMLYLTAYQTIVRPFVIGMGRDVPFPTDVWRQQDHAASIVAAQRIVVVWLVVIMVGYWWGKAMIRAKPSADENTPLELHTTVLARLMIIFTAISTVITLWLWARYGGFSGLIAANKLDKSLNDLQWLRSFAVLSTFVAGASYLAAVASGRRSLAKLALALSILNGVYSFSWGARDAIAITTFGLLAGRLLFNRDEVGAAAILPRNAMDWWRRRRRLVRLLFAVMLVGASVFALRVSRDNLVFGETLGSIENQSTARQIAVATNNTSFDTLALAIDDWPARQDFIGGEQFFIGAQSFLPSLLFGEQDPFSPPAVQVAQYYIPTRQNGWPMTPIGDWYLSWGVLGVMVGGMLSGVVIRLLQIKTENFARNPLVWMLSIVIAFRVMPMGIWANSIPRMMTFALPAALVLIYVQRRRPEVLKARLGAGDPTNSDSSPEPTQRPSAAAAATSLADIAGKVRSAKERRRVESAPIGIVRRSSEPPSDESPPPGPE